ncbi:MAG TPA: hypothetical protein VLT37_01735 [Acidocella sp.]|nr:hypothetical protein [Acidocella sp.]
MPPDLIIRDGAIVAFRMFGIAHEIDLKQVEALWASQARAARRGWLTTTPPKAMAFGVPPVALPLDPVTLELEGASVAAEVTARVYDFGAISFALRVPIKEVHWPLFLAQFRAVDRAVGQGSGTAIWADLLRHVRGLLAPALVRPADAPLEEDYLIGLVHGFDEELPAAALLERIDLVPLLSGERRPLSEGARQDLMRQRFSYYTDDLVVLTWARAFIYEPRGDTDVMDVLEVANARLLETRYYDELLDAELPRMYDLINNAHRANVMFAPRRFSTLARRLYTLVAEVTELTEKLDNALQATGDVYLARIYAAALELFRVHAVGTAVDRKLAIIRDTYAALHDEASSARGELLEILVVVLIALEIVLPFVHL